jgi:membrane-associated protein
MDYIALGPEWLDPEALLTSLGPWAFWASVAIIFAECGLLIGFFLPGDSLLFIVGLLIAQGAISLNIYVAGAILALAAFTGNLTGYWIGEKAGPRLFERPDSRLFKKEYVEKTHDFFEKYGPRAIVLARFVPIVRTFITATAGVARMDFRRFATYSGIGAVLWAFGLTVAGYFLGNITFIKENLEVMIIVIVLVSIIPIAIEYLRHRHQQKKETAAGTGDTVDASDSADTQPPQARD